MREIENASAMNSKEKDVPTSNTDDIQNNDNCDIEYKKIGSTTYEVISNYIGKNSLLDIIKSAIKRDVESGNY